MSNFGDPSSTFRAVKLGVSKAEIVSASSIDTLQEFFDLNVKSLSDETPGKLQSDDDSGGCYQSDFEMDASEPRTPPTPEKAGENEGMRRTDASGEPAKQQAQLHRFEGKTHPLLLTQNILRQSKIYGSSKAASKNHIPKSSSSKKSQKHENIFSRQGSFADNKRVKKSSSFAGLQSKEISTVDQEVDRKAKKQMKKHSQSLGSLSNIDQLAKLQTQVDSLKSLLKEKEEEIKTLKIVRPMQDIAIRNNDKTQVEIPRQYQYQTEELRVLKQTHSHCLQKISSAEKSSQEHIEETIRLKDTIAKMSVLIKSRLGDSGDAMQSEIERLRKELAEKDIIIQESAHFHVSN
ncbi:hypothetical protein HDU82_003696 [Entophlyctis luteolus]|nr:hypothetical protein HDU82_003696 [Entophlyctis luteolus]